MVTFDNTSAMDWLNKAKGLEKERNMFRYFILAIRGSPFCYLSPSKLIKLSRYCVYLLIFTRSRVQKFPA